MCFSIFLSLVCSLFSPLFWALAIAEPLYNTRLSTSRHLSLFLSCFPSFLPLLSWTTLGSRSRWLSYTIEVENGWPVIPWAYPRSPIPTSRLHDNESLAPIFFSVRQSSQEILFRADQADAVMEALAGSALTLAKGVQGLVALTDYLVPLDHISGIVSQL